MSRTFFIIHETDDKNSSERVSLLTEAALARGVRPLALCARTVDFSRLPTPRPGDLLFNCARGGLHLETLLSTPGVASFWAARSHAPRSNLDTTVHTAVHDRLGLPGPATIHHLPDDAGRLKRYVDALGGFPVVVKVRGGSVGLGVIKCSDWESLLSTVEFLNARAEQAILREFVAHDEAYRIILIGDQVACALARPRRSGDFRTTIDGTYRLVDTPPVGVETLARKAAAACDFTFVGVDIIDHPTRGPLLLEANPPCNFTSLIHKGVDIAGMIVDHLLTQPAARDTECGKTSPA